MKLSQPQLTQHLAKNLAPIYLISGDELLLVQEVVDAIRKTAHRADYTERVTITAETGADWGKLIYENAHTISLFAGKKIIELNLSHIKLTSTSGKPLEGYATKPPKETLLVIYTSKLDPKIEKSAWYQAIDKSGVVMPIWPVNSEQLPQWIIQRAKKLNLNITKEAAERLASEVEGNLLAASQEIEKLCLLQPAGTITPETIETAVTDNARFDIFHLVDSALLGNNKRSVRILQTLAAEDIEPTLVLWALTRELRLLSEMQNKIKLGVSLSSLFGQYRIWEKRQPATRAFLQRHPLQSCWELLINSAKIDRIIKGVEKGNVWDELQDLAIKIAGQAVLR